MEWVADTVDLVIDDDGFPHARWMRRQVGVILDGVAAEERCEVCALRVEEGRVARYLLTVRQEQHVGHVAGGENGWNLGAVVRERRDVEVQRYSGALVKLLRPGWSPLAWAARPASGS